MIAMIGIEAIGDDADFREQRRKMSGISKGRMFNHAFRGGGTRAAAMMADMIRYENRPRAWVARITGRDERHGLAREFLRGKKDYREANSTGSRGVYRWFELPEGQVFEVNAPQTWTAADRYFCRSVRGKAVRMTREELDAWLDAGCPDLTRPTAAEPPPDRPGENSSQGA